MTPWEIEHPLYDIRCDAYWLVTRNEMQYRFVGPVALTSELLTLLPMMTPFERIECLNILPIYTGPKGIVVNIQTVET